MRTIIRHQQPLTQPPIDHEHARELAAIGAILDSAPEVLRLVDQDLREGRRAEIGRPGMTAEQVVRVLVVKQLNGYSYEELGFHLADSTTYRTFCRIGAFEAPPSRSALQENVKRLRAETLEAVNRVVLRQAHDSGVEDGSTIRGDCTAVETNIHGPRDSLLLWDAVRVLVGLLKRSKKYGVRFTNHRRRAKRRALGIANTGAPRTRVRLYRDLLRVAESTLADAEKAASRLEKRKGREAHRLAAELKRVAAIGWRVVNQTRCRVLDGEAVPSGEKVVSIFEPHTAVIVKKANEPEYGHKIYLTTGTSSMVLDCMVLEGNPGDATLATTAVERIAGLYDEVPREVVFDGGFTSRENLEALKAMGVDEVAFSKHRGLALSEMVTDTWVYKRLCNFRAGIESSISFLKRCFGLARCLWRGFASFKAYVWSSILSANLLILARNHIAPT